MTRRLLLASLLAILPFSSPSAQNQAAPAVTAIHTAAVMVLHATESLDSRVLVRVPVNSTVSVGTCSAQWCKVTYATTTGSATKESIDAAKLPAAPTDISRGYRNSQGQLIPFPRKTPDNQPPPGASAQCRDGSYSFSATRRGTCSHHSGVARWL